MILLVGTSIIKLKQEFNLFLQVFKSLAGMLKKSLDTRHIYTIQSHRINLIVGSLIHLKYVNFHSYTLWEPSQLHFTPQ